MKRLSVCALALAISTPATLQAQESTLEAFVRPASEGRVLPLGRMQARVLIEAAESGGAYYLFDLTSPPGTGVPPHVHEREDEFLRVTAGEFDVWLDGKVTRVGPGTVVHLPRGVPHGWTTVGSNDGESSWTMVPGESFAQFFEELSAMPPGPPDMDILAALFGKYGITLLPPD